MSRYVLAFIASVAMPMTANCASLHARLSTLVGYSRLIIDEHEGTALTIEHSGDRLVIASNSSPGPARVSGHSSRVTRIVLTPTAIVLDLVAGATVRQFKQRSERIVDIFSSIPVPAGASAIPTAVHRPVPPDQDLVPGLPKELTARIENLQSHDDHAPPKPMGGDQRQPHAKPSTDGAASDIVHEAGPPPQTPQPTQALAASPVLSSGSSQAVLLPFSADVGVAVLRHAHAAFVFFDEARPLDLSSFQNDPVFGRAAVTMSSNFTELMLPVSSSQTMVLSREKPGWLVTLGTSPADLSQVHLAPVGREIHFLMQAPGKALSATDPLTGVALMIGTDREAHDGVRSMRRSETFTIERSGPGLVVEPLSDRLSLRPIRGGFALFRDDGGTLASLMRDEPGPGTSVLTGLTRDLEFEPLSSESLARQLQERLLAAARAPPRARLVPRLLAAQTMLALGLGREARALLRVAFADDPAASDNSHARFLASLADFLGDPDQAALLADPSLPSNDETRLWQALAAPSNPSLSADASAIRVGLPILLSYPGHLRDLAAGFAARVLLKSGHPSDLDAIARLPAVDGTRVAQAVAASRAGPGSDALARLDKLAGDRDLKVASDALLQAVISRVALKEASPSSAANLLREHRLDWRATGQEGPVLMLEADYHVRAGELAQAFELWREASRHFPDLAPAAQDHIVDTLTRLSQPGVADRVSPADFVLIVSDCASELASRGRIAAEIAPILADRLEALDLPGRAIDVLTQVIDATAPGAAKAELGAKLANLLTVNGDPQGAQAALDRSAASSLPPAIDLERHLALSRALERQGRHEEALSAIAGDQSTPAQDQRAAIDAMAGRWHEAKLVLDAMSKQSPERGLLDRKQADVAIRLATAASRDGDTGLLLKLARSVDGRFPEPEQQQTFSLMTAPLTQQVPARPALAGAG